MDQYRISCTDCRCIEVIHSKNKYRIYRIPYGILKRKAQDIKIENPFIVYILLGRNPNGKDVVYVGQSKNGIDKRPLSHEDKCSFWSECFILTMDRDGFINNSVTQYMEDAIAEKARKLSRYDVTTITTNQDTVNEMEKKDSDDFLEYAYNVLYVLGLDLFLEIGEMLIDPPMNHGRSDDTEKVDFHELPIPGAMANMLDDLWERLKVTDNELRPKMSKSWKYGGFSYPVRKKTLMYCVAKVKASSFDVFLYGEAGQYSSPDVIPRTESEKYGNCKAKFIWDGKNTDRLVELASIGMEIIKTRA